MPDEYGGVVKVFFSALVSIDVAMLSMCIVSPSNVLSLCLVCHGGAKRYDR